MSRTTGKELSMCTDLKRSQKPPSFWSQNTEHLIFPVSTYCKKCPQCQSAWEEGSVGGARPRDAKWRKDFKNDLQKNLDDVQAVMKDGIQRASRDLWLLPPVDVL